MLAMFRCTKISPGRDPVRDVSGTRESEQPIQRMEGACEVAREEKRSGLEEEIWETHSALPERTFEMMGSLSGGLY